MSGDVQTLTPDKLDEDSALEDQAETYAGTIAEPPNAASYR